MLRHLADTPHLLETYDDILKDQETRGFTEKVDEVNSTDRVHYIPHHPVRKESSTMNVRVDYDCSFRSALNDPSLNYCLMVGPPFLNNMCSIILRFRTYTSGLSTDNEKAFIHVGLNNEDRDFTRFLWISDPTDLESKFGLYRFKDCWLFGSTSSPFMLNATLHCHLKKPRLTYR